MKSNVEKRHARGKEGAGGGRGRRGAGEGEGEGEEIEGKREMGVGYVSKPQFSIASSSMAGTAI